MPSPPGVPTWAPLPQVLSRVKIVAAKESVAYDAGGLEALVFTADGDMRQGLNNLQATHFGFGFVSQENVFKVCDQPHPLVIRKIISSCIQKDLEAAHWEMMVRTLTAHLPCGV